MSTKNRKPKTVTLSWGHPHPNIQGTYDYRVERLANSVEFHPGQILSRAEVEMLCDSPFWTVQILPKENFE